MANSIITDTGMVAFKPLNDRLLVKRHPKEQMVRDGNRHGILWIPDNAEYNTQTAEIVAMGAKCTDLEVGDTVLLPGVAAKYPDWEYCDYMLVQQGDVGGILT